MNYPPAISAVRQMGLSPISNTCRKSYEQSITTRKNMISVSFCRWDAGHPYHPGSRHLYKHTGKIRRYEQVMNNGDSDRFLAIAWNFPFFQFLRDEWPDRAGGYRTVG
jgi:hypothetical protein